MSSQEPIILVAKIRYSDGQSVRTIGVTDAPYFGDATGLDGGCWWPLLDPESDQGWGESARHPWQGQSDPFQMGDLTLINTGRHFDDWTRHTIAGLVTELQRGPASAVWNDEPDRFDTFHPGKLEPVWRAQGRTRRFEGRERLILSFESLLAPLAGALNTQVFDENTPNQTLINRPTQLVLGQCYQLRPFLLDGQIYLYHVGDNITPVPSVQEGGNPDLPIFEPTPTGFQLFAKPTMTVTCDASGPPLPESVAGDALDGIGHFEFDSGNLVGWDVIDDPPWSQISETAGGLLRVESTARLEGDTGWLAGSEAYASQKLDGTTWSTVGGTLAEVVEADDGSYAELTADDNIYHFIAVSGVTFGLTEDVVPVGLEIRGVAEANNTANIVGFWLKYPDGTVREFPFSSTLWNGKETFTAGHSTWLPWGFKKEMLEDPETDFRIIVRRTSGPIIQFRIHELNIKCHFGPAVDRLRLITTDSLLTPGTRYELRVQHEGDSSDMVDMFWGGIENNADPLAERDDPFARTAATLEADGSLTASFVAAGPRFAMEFDRGQDGNGEQTIRSVELIDRNLAQEKYRQLVPYIVDLAGLDPDLHVSQDMIEAHDLATGSMSLGWLVKGSETADDVLALLAGSLGGMLWHDRGGRVKSMLLQPPQDDDDALVIGPERIDGDIEIWDDTPEGVTDRATAARNWQPIPEDRAAGTLSEQEKANAAADFRVVRRAKFPELDGFTPAPEPPSLTLNSIDPNTGDEAGGTAVTLTGTGFAEFDAGEGDTWTIGGEPVTNITVVSDTEMTGETPAGTGESDVVVTIGEESDTLVDGFEYEAAAATPEWHTADQKTRSEGSEGTYDIDNPDNVSADDLLVFIAFGRRTGSGAEITTPTGFTDALEFFGPSSVNGYIKVATRVADGTEPAAHTYSVSNVSNRSHVLMGRVTGHSLSSPIGEVAANAASSTDTFDTPSLEISSNTIIIHGVTLDNGLADVTPPAGMDNVVSLQQSTHTVQVVKEAPESSGSTGTRSWSAAENRNWSGFAIEVKP
jgi:hypothetical protein